MLCIFTDATKKNITINKDSDLKTESQQQVKLESDKEKIFTVSL